MPEIELKRRLKPCPFCGGLAVITFSPCSFGKTMATVNCAASDCGATLIAVRGDMEAARETATRVWNRRAGND